MEKISVIPDLQNDMYQVVFPEDEIMVYLTIKELEELKVAVDDMITKRIS